MDWRWSRASKAKNPAAKPNWAVSNELSKEAVILEGGAQEVTDPSRIKELAPPDQRSYKPEADPGRGALWWFVYG